MKYRALIFDMDGTVLNTLEDLHDAVNAMRAHEGLSPLSLSYVRQSVGNGVGVLMDKTLPADYAHRAEAERFYRGYYESHCLIKTAPYPGILPLMDALGQRGIAMAVVSNKQDAAVQPLKEHFFGNRLDYALGTTDALPRKPHPEMVWACVEALGVRREQCLFAGDSEVDIATARNAGLDVAAVSWGFRDRGLLESLKPDYLVDSPMELLKLFE